MSGSKVSLLPLALKLLVNDPQRHKTRLAEPGQPGRVLY
jgi:hypothetical protein